jgi:glycosyltransferase involved in cell wall biosynthesis
MTAISATIITLNEEGNIGDCLASLGFVAEIIVLDSGSSDRTEEICRAFPKVRFFQQVWQGYGKQKNSAAGLAVNDWILNIDADERVSDELRDSICRVARGTVTAYRMARENYFGGRWIKQCGWFPDYTTRLYDRRSCRFIERSVHESLQCSGGIGTLAGNLRHFTYQGISDYLERMNRYSSLAAEEIVKSGRNPGVAAIICKPFFTFFKMYVIKRGFLEGRLGFQLSVLYAVYTFAKYAKARELNNTKLQRDTHVV